MRAAKARERVEIPKRRLGNGDFCVSALGLGCMGMSEFYGATDDNESIATLHRALDNGINLLDTADIYGIGRNEELVGRALRGRRESALVSTKFGTLRSPDGTFHGVSGSPDYVRQACEASLRRLRVETIDLYFQHRVDPEVPIEETVGAMAGLVRQGKVRFLGLSEAAATTIRRAAKVHPIAALQSEYSLWTRDVESEILPLCRELGIGFVAYSPLGRGFLTGRFRSERDFSDGDARRATPRYQGENLRRNLVLVERIEKLAAKKRCTPAQLALAWTLAQGEDIVPIAGTKRRKFLDENLESLAVSLTSEELRQINLEFPPGIAAGDRYRSGGMATLNK